MSLRLLFLGRLADLAGDAERTLEMQGSLDWQGLRGRLESRLVEELDCEKVRVALNGTVLADKSMLRACEGDELAFLPPVSGG